MRSFGSASSRGLDGPPTRKVGNDCQLVFPSFVELILLLTWLLSGFFYQRFAEKKEHGTDSDDKAGTETDSDINAMVRLSPFSHCLTFAHQRFLFPSRRRSTTTESALLNPKTCWFTRTQRTRIGCLVLVEQPSWFLVLPPQSYFAIADLFLLPSGRYVTMSISKDTGKSNLLWVADLEEVNLHPHIQASLS